MKYTKVVSTFNLAIGIILWRAPQILPVRENSCVLSFFNHYPVSSPQPFLPSAHKLWGDFFIFQIVHF